MKIGIISNSDYFIPLAGALSAQHQQAYIFYSPSPDTYINHKVKIFLCRTLISFVEEGSKDGDLYNWLNNGKFDVCFVVGYSKLIKLDRIHQCSTPVFNIHFGPLPAFKGPAPIFWQLKQGVNKLGLVIHRLTDKFDEGAVVWHKELINQDFFSYKHVEQIFSTICVEGAFFILQLMLQKLPILDIARNGINPSWQSKPKMEDILIYWDLMDAQQVCNLVRACNPWNKGALTFFKGSEVKMMDARVVRLDDKREAGIIISIDDKLKIKCCDGNGIELSMLYFMDTYCPAYHLKQLGFGTGDVFENTPHLKDITPIAN